MRGPRNMGPRPKVKKGTLMRVLKYMMQTYWIHMILVVIFIITNAVCTLQGTLFMQKLIDVYILPMINTGSRDFAPLAAALRKLAAILLLGIFSAYAYNRIMVTVGQGTMEKIRVELFSHMQTLPIKYFDTHAHGDIMSVYTNDIDTMRQVISQTIPQVINSGATIVTTFVSMVRMSIPLTGVSLIMIMVMMIVSGKIGGQSRKYFVERQKTLGAVNGYVEEMVEGQKVIKVFCHEERAVERFIDLNEKLREAGNNANKFANILMPINANLGNISYVLIAVTGAWLALSGVSALTLGSLVSFLTLNRNFTRPVSQIS